VIPYELKVSTSKIRAWLGIALGSVNAIPDVPMQFCQSSVLWGHCCYSRIGISPPTLSCYAPSRRILRGQLPVVHRRIHGQRSSYKPCLNANTGEHRVVEPHWSRGRAPLNSCAENQLVFYLDRFGPVLAIGSGMIILQRAGGQADKFYAHGFFTRRPLYI
jgi:hypothetical protein